MMTMGITSTASVSPPAMQALALDDPGPVSGFNSSTKTTRPRIP